jgi:PBP1b-binding outer membrane lipoprotein LpoB
MKKIILTLLLYLFIAGCCQPEGNYEECVRKGHAICIDIYPKCNCDNKR